MRKDRNSFFAETQMYGTGYANPNMMPNTPYPYQAAQSTNSFYAGAAPVNNDLESRLAKIERQIHRLESRLSKLETTLPNSYATEDIDVTTNSMYMI